jgi:hypothetical protein
LEAAFLASGQSTLADDAKMKTAGSTRHKLKNQHRDITGAMPAEADKGPLGTTSL